MLPRPSHADTNPVTLNQYGRNGWARSYNPLFDPDFYPDSNADVAEAVLFGDLEW